MPELRQETFQGAAIGSSATPAAPGEPHLACVLLLDTSGSMSGSPIESLNNAINAFKADACADELTQKRVDVAIVEFNDVARVVQPFVPIGKMEPIRLQATGCTAMGSGIDLAIDLVKERNRLYAQMGTPCYAPWIVMITDGAPTDDVTMAAQRIKAEEAKGTHGKLKFWMVGVPGYSLETLAKLSSKRRIIELATANFKGFFNWLTDSMTIISVSQVGDKVKLSSLPPEARVITKQDIPDEWTDD